MAAGSEVVMEATVDTTVKFDSVPKYYPSMLPNNSSLQPPPQNLLMLYHSVLIWFLYSLGCIYSEKMNGSAFYMKNLLL